ncbi:hypothetical protein CO057_00130 [Candidatus Uhrbacteria bacterium CG_4_9_14_0_2_um_filter_41_50]|uniref:Phosphoribosyltransferase domain-containing protein n=1 Tax=Candidatus Uhrbacteria bacterium CG_4_9_14_0_2_um_filter_41_50 TaxID=1975031 RepID=A0A2M8EQC2_9BACT|nr:MAG: hypothetical protein COZ45_03275 [Candidatus Uhrbacteria bacterium CG_4_10_14_3_um_filter_41_21]PIZ55494.1 MAG: hypothetical protein COY24_00135 [Candidatus Uhrbacteria bacterium CG_4_10_14_0_2_um_filter_41_21]PJB84698.1 MAG: hypothetical protein CO086_02305 [Candidatus Uhrbacteria bacterium CG_4_9_14_0_8_um_filter_41_16]PJC24945.1 MAG: hypothetical protein CO057_00130 [Candidatus Uhrbacteria bacterium CG_4_9_14_0_2_um_filter_41_50]PJE74681.1 MAG: hypothetical protein COV03_04140 [Candi
MNKAENILKTIKNAVFPRFCVSCRAEGRLLCDFCNANWQPPSISLKNVVDGHLASFNYADPIARQLICAWKYHYDQSAWEHLKSKLRPGLANLRHIVHARKIEAVVPVPLHNRRLCERGFDQAVEISKFIASEMDLPMVEVLTRNRSTGKQAEREVEERVQSMINNPFVLKSYSATKLPTSILLIDDVFTTGATAKAASEILQRAGVKNVMVYTLAKGK